MNIYAYDLSFWIYWWLGAMTVMTLMFSIGKRPSVGLSQAYVANFTVNHFFGGLIYALPWYAGPHFEFATVGFAVSTIGMISFAAGVLLLGPLLILIGNGIIQNVNSYIPNSKLPVAYIFTGAVLFFLLSPILKRIPSIGVLAMSGWSVMILGICLATWQAWKLRGRKILRWVLLTLAFPVITTIMQGFLGYGISALLVVICFVARFYRPRWKLIIAGALALMMGLSLFVTYFRDRDQMRQDTWHDRKSLRLRSENMYNSIIRKFEIINFKNDEHLIRIDDRLNQNILVGKAVFFMGSGMQKPAHGSTLIEAVIALVPRIIWPEKPVFAGSGDYVSIYTGETFADGTSVGMGQVLEFYINFGVPGVIIGFLILGGIVAFVDTGAGLRLYKGDWLGCVFWFLPGLAFLQAGGSLVEVTSTFATSLVTCILINKYVVARFSGQRVNWRKILSIFSNRKKQQNPRAKKWTAP